MCLLVAKPAGIVVPNVRQMCERANRANPDGFGLAWVQSGHLFVHKGMLSTDEQVECLEFLNSETNVGDAIFHWRFGTSGGKTEVNCHPFEILPSKLVLAHNGVCGTPSLPGISDTHELALGLRSMPERIHDILEEIADTSNKFATLSPDKGYTLYGAEHGQWRDGIWLSNTYWDREPVTTIPGFGGLPKWRQSNWTNDDDYCDWNSYRPEPIYTHKMTTIVDDTDDDLEEFLIELCDEYGYRQVTDRLWELKRESKVS